MRILIRWTWLIVAAALIYAAGTLYLRRRSSQELERQAAQQRAEFDRKSLDLVGGGQLKILTLYASPASLHKGQKGLICYGVASARTVSIQPAVDGVGPAISRCVEIRPEHDTEYTLMANDGHGHSEQRRLTVAVR